MAATLTGNASVFGNMRVFAGTFTMASTSTTGTVIVPGMKKIYAANFTAVSGATAVYSIHLNLTSAGTATDGHLGITSALSSNIFSVLVVGA